MENNLKEFPKTNFTKKIETAGKKGKVKIKKHIDEYFDKDFINLYFKN